MSVTTAPYSSAAASFIGRDAELAEIDRLLADPTCLLITLCGPGGIGKTRLAQAVLRQQSGRFADGGFFIPLESLSSQEQIAPTIAAVLGVRLNAGGDPSRALIHYLRPMRMLLVLDNFEHLIAGAEVLSALLAEAPGVRLLITSRERLRLVEEWVYDVNGLNVPLSADCDGMGEFSAVQLYAALARRVQPRFSLEEDCAAVVRICQLLGGMPLALELAASWARALTTSEIAGEIERGLDILNTSARNMPVGHRCMRAVLDQSWAMLNSQLQDVFARLSVFRGGFRSDAAAIVAGAARADLLELLDKSWLRRSPESGRYSLHELARQYGAERLRDLNRDEVAIHERHARFYAEFLDAQWPRLHGNDYKASYLAIEAELDNIRTAWRWNIERHHLNALHLSLRSLWVFFDSGSRFREGEQLFAQAVERMRQAGPEAQPLLARLLARQGALQFSLDNFPVAHAILEESLDHLSMTGYREDIAFAELELAMTIGFSATDIQPVIALLESALRHYQAIHDEWGTAYTEYWISVILSNAYVVQREAAMLERAETLTESAEWRFRQINNAWGLANVQIMMSSLAAIRGDWQASYEAAYRCKITFEELGVIWGVSQGLIQMTSAAVSLERPDHVRQAAAEGLRLALKFGLTNHALHLLHEIARMLAAQQDERLFEVLGAIETQRLLLGRARDVGSLELLELLDQPQPPDRAAAIERGRARRFEEMIREWIATFEAQASSAPAETRAQSLAEPLTSRELEVLQLVAEGMSNREIATALYLSVGTVKAHIHHLSSKLGASNRTQAGAMARQLGLIKS